MEEERERERERERSRSRERVERPLRETLERDREKRERVGVGRVDTGVGFFEKWVKILRKRRVGQEEGKVMPR